MELLKDVKLKEGEEFIKAVYHHPMVIIPHLVISFFILILDFFLMYFLFLQGWWGVALFAAVIVVVLFYFLRIVFLYKKNKFLITNQRIVDFEQPSFFEKYKNEISLYKIKEIEVIKKGLVGMIFGYGTLKLHIKNEVTPLELFRISKPEKLQEEIRHLMGEETEGIKEATVKDDPITLILAETKLLSLGQKEDLIERIGQQIDADESEKKGEAENL